MRWPQQPNTCNSGTAASENTTAGRSESRKARNNVASRTPLKADATVQMYCNSLRPEETKNAPNGRILHRQQDQKRRRPGPFRRNRGNRSALQPQTWRGRGPKITVGRTGRRKLYTRTNIFGDTFFGATCGLRGLRPDRSNQRVNPCATLPILTTQQPD